MTTDLAPGPTAPMPGPAPARGPGSVIARIVLTLIILLFVAMWIYAFLFAEKQGLYVLEDESWTERAQGICEVYEQQRIALADTADGYIENPTEQQMLQRADIVDRATDILEAELADVFAVLPASARDQEIALEYKGYYEHPARLHDRQRDEALRTARRARRRPLIDVPRRPIGAFSTPAASRCPRSTAGSPSPDCRPPR